MRKKFRKTGQNVSLRRYGSGIDDLDGTREEIKYIEWRSEVMLSLHVPVADKFATPPAACLLAYGEITVQSRMVPDHLWSEQFYSNRDNFFIFPRGTDGGTMEFTQCLQIVLEYANLFGRNFDKHGVRNMGFFFILY